MQALQTATLNPAKFLHREADMGTIEKNKLAGRYFPRGELDAMLSQAAAAAAASR